MEEETPEGMTLHGVWTEEGDLAAPQADLFSGWRPCSGSFPAAGIVTGRGAYSMGSISESPSADAGFSACSLAATLETETDWLRRHPGRKSSDFWSYLRKYFLSARAAAGILRRAEARGRALPPALESALRELASGAGPQATAEEDSSEEETPRPPLPDWLERDRRLLEEWAATRPAVSEERIKEDALAEQAIRTPLREGPPSP